MPDPSEGQTNRKDMMQMWLVSLAISVFCCALFFAFLSMYVADISGMLMRIDERLANIEQRANMVANMPPPILVHPVQAPLTPPAAIPPSPPAGETSEATPPSPPPPGATPSTAPETPAVAVTPPVTPPELPAPSAPAPAPAAPPSPAPEAPPPTP